MALTASDYLHQLQALLPPGAAWPTDSDATLTRLLAALAEEFARVDIRAEQLVDEALPEVTNELFSDWERVAGLPDACAGDILTSAQRRASLIARLTAVGGQSRAYYTDVADALGYEITIDEFALHDVECDVDYPLYDDPWAHAWRVNEPPSSIGYLSVDDTVDDPFSWWGMELLECMIGRLKPAHTVVLYGQISYADGTPAADLYDDAALYGKADTIAAIDRLHAVLHTTIPSWT
ncbi:YmfQ family protein [Azonexus sp.]|uniref:YmfQ family protein n=1 Tax=Azonexus sp. TaxID=1872668 RepID=UPI0035AE1C0B